MNNFVTVVSSSIKAAVRSVKILRYGKADVQTPSEISPYGLDSNPIKDMVAMYAATDVKGENAIIGYINKNQKAAPGEFRTFCTDADGVEKFYTWMKVDGTMEIGGTADNMVRYSELNTGVQNQATDINTELATISALLLTIGLTYTVVPIVPDISASKINEIKTL